MFKLGAGSGPRSSSPPFRGKGPAGKFQSAGRMASGAARLLTGLGSGGSGSGGGGGGDGVVTGGGRGTVELPAL